MPAVYSRSMAATQSKRGIAMSQLLFWLLYRSTLCTYIYIYIYIFEKSASSFELSRISPSSSCRLHSPQCSKRTKTAVAWCNRLCGLLLAHLLIYTCRGAQVCVRDSCLRVTFTIILSNARYYVDQACHKTV